MRTATLLAAGDQHLGKDIVQIALTKLYVAWPRVRSETRNAYLHRTLVHTLVDDRRQRARRPETSSDPLPEHPLPEAADAALGEESGRRSPRCPRACARPSCCATGWTSMSAAAAALGCSAGTVKSQASRGLDKLRTHLLHT